VRWSILRPLGISHVHFVITWYVFPSFGMLYQEKSGSPACDL
jgi:hypothetical protein